MKKDIFFLFVSESFRYEFWDFSNVHLACHMALARSFVCPRSALCETSGIEE